MAHSDPRDDFEPFLQIIHISDLHVTDPRSPHSAAIRAWVRWLGNVHPALAEYVDDGTAPSDRIALTLFEDFISEISTDDPEWSKHKTWLIDTGDLTSLGDQDSLAL